MLLRAASSCTFWCVSCSSCSLSSVVLLLELGVEPLALGDVLVRDDATAAGHAPRDTLMMRPSASSWMRDDTSPK